MLKNLNLSLLKILLLKNFPHLNLLLLKKENLLIPPQFQKVQKKQNYNLRKLLKPPTCST